MNSTEHKLCRKRIWPNKKSFAKNTFGRLKRLVRSVKNKLEQKHSAENTFDY